MEALNPKLNAFCAPTADLAMESARAAEAAVMAGDNLGPLHGVPFSVKDLALTKGIPSQMGSHIFKDRVPDRDAAFVPRLREAGGIMLGKTTTPEFGWKALSDCPLTGATHNPWKEGYSAGGSSAGAGSAVAAGIGPLGQGSDGAGSIRVPSSFCGLFGIKPTFGRVPNVPLSNNDYSSHIGPMTRTVEDAALMLGVMGGPHPLDHTSLPDRPDYLHGLRQGIRGLRVAYSPDLGYLRVDPEVADAVKAAVAKFEDFGCTVEEVNPGLGDPGDILRLMWNAHYHGLYGSNLPEFESRMDPGLVAAIRDGARYSLADYIAARGRKIDYVSRMNAFFDRYDLLITPSTSVTSFPLHQLNPDHWPQHEWDWFDWAGFSYPFNFSGNPASTVPVGFSGEGLPIGMQIAGRRFEDSVVLRASACYEEARPWAQHRPPLDN